LDVFEQKCPQQPLYSSWAWITRQKFHERILYRYQILIDVLAKFKNFNFALHVLVTLGYFLHKDSLENRQCRPQLCANLSLSLFRLLDPHYAAYCMLIDPSVYRLYRWISRYFRFTILSLSLFTESWHSKLFFSGSKCASHVFLWSLTTIDSWEMSGFESRKLTCNLLL